MLTRYFVKVLMIAVLCSGSSIHAAVTTLSTSQTHSVIVSANGQVCSVGRNEYGELGDGTFLNRYTLIPAAEMPDAVAVATGWYHTLAVKSDGTVWSWGGNGYSELGDGTSVNKLTPAKVPGITGVIAVAAGYDYSLALKSDGTVWAWGWTAYGDLGTAPGSDSSVPNQVVGISGVTAIAAESHTTLALKSDGTVWAWGYNGYGEMGTGNTTGSSVPVQVPNFSNVVAIAAGSDHGVAVKGDGTLWTWGYNANGQLGIGNTAYQVLPVHVTGLSGVVTAAAGDTHTLAVLSDGTVWAWGANGSGQLGNNTMTQNGNPVQVMGMTNAVSVAGGTNFSLATKNDGTVWGWGDNFYGQLGIGSSTAITLIAREASPCTAGPLQGPPKTSVSGRLAASQNFGLAVKNDGTVLSWGQNQNGQLGDGSTTNRTSPVQPSGLSNVKAVAAGWHHTLALKSDGTVWAWGSNAYGALGDGTSVDKSSPFVVPGLTGMVAVAAGYNYSLALKSDGTVWAWGWTAYGDLGTAPGTNSSIPNQVLGISGVVSIVAQSHTSLALKSDGTVWAWGYNGYGEMGTGTTSGSSVPIQVANFSGAVAIAAGTDHALALKSDGTVWTWGYNANGQLGDGSGTGYQPYIVRATDLTNVVAIGAGDSHSLAVKSDGTVWAWGANANGQLGNNTVTESVTPTQVQTISNALAVAGGTMHSLALTSSGTIYAWGDNSYGQFGVPLPLNNPVPNAGPQVGAIYKLTLLTSPANSGIVATTPFASDSNFPVGTNVCVSAVPAPGYIFSGWSGANLDASDCLVLTGSTSVTANFSPLPSRTSLSYVPVTPCRIADTRNPAGPLGGPAIPAGGSRTFPVPSSACNIPLTAEAYSLNVTVVPSGSLGFVTLWPTGQAQPNASTLNSLDGRVKANAAIVPAGAGGSVSVFASDATHVILDVNGYFVPSSDTSALAFYPLAPCRIADTRQSPGALSGPSLTAGQARTFPVLIGTCTIPNTAQAYSLNFTALPKAKLSFMTVWPAGQTQPGVSTLNAPTGAVTANAAVVPAGASGSINVFATDATDLLIDVNGYFGAPASGGLSLYNVSPCRIADTRNPAGSAPFSGTISTNAAGTVCGLPSTAQALVLNATVVPPAPLGFLTLWPSGQTQPGVSTLNAYDGAVTSNLALVPASGGALNAFASNPTYLILDLSGYFAP